MRQQSGLDQQTNPNALIGLAFEEISCDLNLACIQFFLSHTSSTPVHNKILSLHTLNLPNLNRRITTHTHHPPLPSPPHPIHPLLMRTPHADPLSRLPHTPHKNHRIQRPRHSPLPGLIPINARHAPSVATPTCDYRLRVIGFVDDDFSGCEADGQVFACGGGEGKRGYGGWVRDVADFLEGEVVHVLGGVVAADGDVG